jgi:hypothetical protein
MPSDINGELEHERVEAAYEAFRKAFKDTKSGKREDERIS